MISLLYVDDEKDLLLIGKTFLEKYGDFIVDTVTSPIEALQILSSTRYDAVIADYEMPAMNGIDLLKEIRSRFGDIPYILFTGRGREEVVIQAINNGANFYLQKGGEPQSLFAELGNQIRQAVAKRQAEESLLTSMQKLQIASSRYEALISASNTGAWEYYTNGKMWCSTEYFSMLGRSVDDYQTDGYQDITKVWVDLMHPDDRAQAVSSWYSYIAHPEGMYEQYFRMKHQEGNWIWILSRGKMLLDSSGNPAHVMIGTHIDVTKQKHIEEELEKKNEELQAAYEEITAGEEELRDNYHELSVHKEALETSEKRYALTLESINDGLWDFNVTAGILFLSPQFYRMSGYEPDAFYPNTATWLARIYPEDQERVQSAFDKTFMNGNDLRVEYRTQHRDGTYQWMLTRGKVAEWKSDGSPHRIVGTQSNIATRKFMESTLEEKSRILQTLTDNLPGMVYRCKNDPDWTMEVLSDGVFSLTGYQKEEMIYNRDISFGSIIHPDDQEKVWRFVEDGVTRNTPYQLTYRIICKDGSEKWVWEQGRGVFHGGTLLALEGYISDITSEIIAQKALQKMAHSIEHLKEGVFWFNHEGIIFDANIAFVEFPSQSREEIIGSHVSTLPMTLPKSSWPDLMLTAKKDGSATEDALMLITPDAERNLRMSISYGVFGDEIVFCGIVNDRTREEEYLREVMRNKEELASAYEELLSSEEALKDQYIQLADTKDALMKSEQNFRSIFEDAILGIFQVTLEGTFLEVNPAFSRMYGYDSPDEMKSAINDIRNQLYVHPEDRDKILTHLYQQGEVRNFEYEQYRKDGSIFWISINEKVIRNDEGEIILLEGTIEDITRRKNIESEYEIALSQVRKNFAEFSILNDGIRNPLTIISILAESLEPQITEQITKQINQIDDLIRQLDNRWMESEKVIRYLQKHHNF